MKLTVQIGRLGIKIGILFISNKNDIETGGGSYELTKE